MISRTIEPYAQDVTTRHPVVVLTGPRQSGKTTLCRRLFPERRYVSLETPTERAFALEDPIGFLAKLEAGAVIDEVQRAPQLPSYLQAMVDDDPTPGRFVLTGSRNLLLLDSVSQSLAGRTAIVELLPLALEEIARFPAPRVVSTPPTLEEILWTGGYPRIHDQRLPPDEWLEGYVATYVERDVRQILKIGDLLTFQLFLRLCAGRTGTMLNLTSLANDCGIARTTAREWLSVLEASYIVFRLPAYHANLGKRLIKKPKLYFWDVGLACHLIGIETSKQLATHPLRGALFETWAVSEIGKYFHHRGRRPRLYFYRDRGGHEVDLLVERGADLIAIEIKAAATPSSRYFATIGRLADSLAEKPPMVGGRVARRIVIYGGDETQKRSGGTILSWQDVPAGGWMDDLTETST